MNNIGQRRPCCGVTLLELLVVIAALILLIAIYLPAQQGLRSRARDAMCMSNQRQIYLGLSLYDETYGRLPNALVWVSSHPPDYTLNRPPSGWWYTDPNNPTIPNTPETSMDRSSDGRFWFWQQFALEFLDQDRNVMGCPASKTGVSPDTGNQHAKYAGNYGAGMRLMKFAPRPDRDPNGTVTYPDPEDWNSPLYMSMKLADVRQPASVGLFWDSGQHNLAHHWATHPVGYAWYIPGYHINEWEIMSGPHWGNFAILPNFHDDALFGRHPGNRINICYVDGHLGSMHADDFVDGVGSTPEDRERDWRTRWYEW